MSVTIGPVPSSCACVRACVCVVCRCRLIFLPLPLLSQDELGGMLLLSLPDQVLHRIDAWSPLHPTQATAQGAAPFSCRFISSCFITKRKEENSTTHTRHTHDTHTQSGAGECLSIRASCVSVCKTWSSPAMMVRPLAKMLVVYTMLMSIWRLQKGGVGRW